MAAKALWQIPSKEWFDCPGVVDADAKRASILEHFEDLLSTHLLSRAFPIITEAAFHIASGIYAVGENERPSTYPHLPKSLSSHAGRKGSHDRITFSFVLRQIVVV